MNAKVLDMPQKYKVLAWSDSVLAPTGFGTVSRHVLNAISRTGRYHLDQLAINYRGEFYDPALYPFQMSPAGVMDPSDPYGKRQLLRSLDRGDYDLLWILNDLLVIQPVVSELKLLREHKLRQTGRSFKTIIYFPVDGQVFPADSAILDLADVAVTYTHWGRQQTLQSMPAVAAKLQVIYHGSAVEDFRPLPAEARRSLRQQFGIGDPQTFFVANVNGNYPRKDLPRSILAFAQFKKRVPNSIMYMHTDPNRAPFELLRCCQCAGLTPNDIRFPASLDAGGYPIEAVNNIYNAADALLTTTLGEGWGLTINEAMCAGTPVVAPNNSSIPELLGADGERGYVYDCREQVWVDNGGYRPAGRVEDIVTKLHECHEQRGSARQREIIARAAEFTRQHTWSNACRHWVELFERMAKLG
jgi:glycosyltransferase involved in cell wall biosynthesis